MINEEIELTSKQKLIGNLAAGGCLILCGIFLLLTGLNVIPLKIQDIIIASLLFSVGLVLAVTGLVHKNTVSIWLSFAFLVPGVIEILAKYTSFGYNNLYPIYIAIPAIASVFTVIYSRQWSGHVSCILFFGIIAGVFSLESSGLFGWSVVVPLLVILLGALIVLFAFKVRKKDGDEQEKKGAADDE